MLATFRIGAVWVPTNFRLMPDDVAYMAEVTKPRVFLCQTDFPEHAEAVSRVIPEIQRVWLTGEARGQGDGPSADALIDAQAGRTVANATVQWDSACWLFFTSGTTGRPKAAVLTHGQMALRHHQSSVRPDARRHRGGRLARAGAAVARRRRAPAEHDRSRRQDGVDAVGQVRCRDGLRADREAPPDEPVHRADDPEDAGRGSQRRPARPLEPALCRLRRRADVPPGSEAGAAETGAGAGAVLRPGRGDRQHHRAAEPRTRRWRRRAPARHLRLRAHGHAGFDPGRRRKRVGCRRDGRDLRRRAGGVRRLLRKPGGERQVIPQRLVPHRRPGLPGPAKATSI